MLRLYAIFSYRPFGQEEIIFIPRKNAAQFERSVRA